MEQVIQALHDPIQRCKWDSNIDKMHELRNVQRVQVIQTINKPHFLESTVRDMFEKKFGFTHRPPVATTLFDNDKSISQDV